MPYGKRFNRLANSHLRIDLVGYYPITDRWRAEFVGSYRWFTDEADDSPIITAEDGSDNGLFVGFGFTRQFNLS